MTSSEALDIKVEQIDKKYEENEHSLEMHLPYIRYAFKERAADPDTDVTIVPLMIGQIPSDNQSKYGKLLAPYFSDEKILFVVSSDFCHWGSRFNFTHKYNECDHIFESIEKLDKQGMSLIAKHDLQGFQAYLKETKNTICGRFPIQVLLATIGETNGNIESQFLKYDQSSKVDSMDDSSVSYASAISF